MTAIKITSLFFLTATLIGNLTACSLYKSAQRKEFESQSLDRVTQNSFTETANCEYISTTREWLEKEFPRAETELLIAQTHFEAWKQRTAQNRLRLLTFESTDQGVLFCRKDYPTEEEFFAALPSLQ